MKQIIRDRLDSLRQTKWFKASQVQGSLRCEVCGRRKELCALLNNEYLNQVLCINCYSYCTLRNEEEMKNDN